MISEIGLLHFLLSLNFMDSGLAVCPTHALSLPQAFPLTNHQLLYRGGIIKSQLNTKAPRVLTSAGSWTMLKESE